MDDSYKSSSSASDPQDESQPKAHDQNEANSPENPQPAESAADPSGTAESATTPEPAEPPADTVPTTVEKKRLNPPPAEVRDKSEVRDEDDDLEDDTGEERQLGGRMTFLEHLDELRKRIFRSVIAMMVTFVVAWVFREEIFAFMAVPILDVVEKLVVTKPTEPFTIYLKVSFMAAIFLAAPFILYQVWMFIAPGLYRKEKVYALPFLFASTVLFLLGGAFAYYIVVPPALNFLLLEFGKNFQHMITAIEFYDFLFLVIVGMGAIFQLPVLVAFLSIFGLITPRFLWKNFRYAFLIITIIAAVVSPTTDPFNLFLWSGPMVILYTISIAVSWVFKRRRDKDGKSESRW